VEVEEAFHQLGGGSTYLFNEWPLARFLQAAYDARQDPKDWEKRARWLLLENPAERIERSRHEFGSQANLHMCASHLIENRDENPVLDGHRAVVYFSLAKMLTNWELCDHEEALMYMTLVNDASPDRVPDSELRRILGNAERGGFTSTGCDDPSFAPYAHPDCPIAKGAV